MHHVDHLARVHAVAGADCQADQVAVVVLLRVLWALVLGHLGLHEQVAQLLGRGPVRYLGELHQQPAAVPPAGGDGEGPRDLGVRDDAGAVGEPPVRLVRPDIHTDLALDSMRPADPPDCDQHPHKDRKSTRLNSSHVEISYAVFCLKKKKTTNSTRSYGKKKTAVTHV